MPRYVDEIKVRTREKEKVEHKRAIRRFATTHTRTQNHIRAVRQRVRHRIVAIIAVDRVACVVSIHDVVAAYIVGWGIEFTALELRFCAVHAHCYVRCLVETEIG